jgi:ribosomal protein S18 acetylase RimI-like enzyme
MPEIEIKPANNADLSMYINMDHSYQTDYVWQMDRIFNEGQMTIQFREIRLPRPVKVEYPYSSSQLSMMWNQSPVVLTAYMKGSPVGYVYLEEDELPQTGWIKGLAVNKEDRRQGIASGLILAAQEWALQRNLRRLSIPIQSKNYPALRMFLKIGYEFCGYQDNYFSNRDIGLFFSRFLR